MMHKLKKRIISFVLCVSMLIPMLTHAMPVYSVGATDMNEVTTNYGTEIGAVGTVKNSENLLLANMPAGQSGQAVINGVDISGMPEKIVIKNYYYDNAAGTEDTKLWYEIDAAPGYNWPADYAEYHWTYAYSVDILTQNGMTGVFGADGKVITTLTLPLYDKIPLTAESSLQGDVKYQWQIEYEDGKWVDIYGEDEAELTVSIGMIATLLVDDSVNVRCVSSSASKIAISDSITITVDFNIVDDEGDEPVDPTVPTLEIQMDGASVDSITTTYGNYDFEATLTAATTLSNSLTYKWEVLTDATNDLWSMLSTDATCYFTYGDMQFKYYDASSDISTIRLTVSNGETSLTDTFIVYRVAEVYVTNSTGDITGTVDVTVSGSLPNDASLNLGDASDTTIGGVDASEIALALDVTITQYGEEWQPAEGETVRVSIPASQLGLGDGEYFTVYHIHDGNTELLGPFKVENGYVTFEIDGFSVVVISTNYGAAIGGVAEFAGSSVILDSGAVYFGGTTVWVEDANLPEKVVIKNYVFDEYLGKLFYEIDAAPGYTWPEAYADLHWCYSDALANIDVNGSMGVFDENRNLITDISVSVTESVTINAETSLQSADIAYKWQICYDIVNDLWVDITGESEAEITITAGMIAGLMDENNQVRIRCSTSVGSKTIISDSIMVTLCVEDSGNDEELSLEIQIDGVTTDSVDVKDADKYDFASVLTASTNLTGNLTYQWEVLSDTTNGVWEVLGIADTFEPSFDMWGEGVYVGKSYYVHYVDATTSAITIRLTVSDGVTSLQDTFVINLKYEEAEETVAVYSLKARSVTTYASNGGIATAADTTTTYNVIINYMNQDGTAVVSDPYTSTVSPTTILTNTITFPKILGYVPMVYNVDEAKWVRQDSYTFDGSLFTEDFSLEVHYYPDAVDYKVNIYLQNAENDEYALMNSYTRQELTGTVIESITFNVDGYYQSKFSSNSASIAADGSTEFNLYYDRIYYLMKFDLDGGYGVQPVYARHGTALDISNPTKAGYTFVGWDQTEGKPAVDGELLNDGIQNTIYTEMPIGNTAYKAIWKAVDNAKVTIVYWGENANDEGYSYLESQELYVKPGTELTFGTNQRVCTLTEHTHGTGCTYDCGKTPHTHSLDNDCYTLKCTIESHNHTESGCTLNCTHTHELSCYNVEYGTLTETSKPSESLTNAGDGIYTYVTSVIFIGDVTHYYLNIGNKWYASNAEVFGDAIPITLSCTHGHTNVCYSCGLNEGTHVHSVEQECYDLICTTEAHTHTDECYSCIAHTHNDDCYLKTTNQDSKLWTFVKSDTVTVVADGSTVMNVYYDRVTYDVEFHRNQDCTNEYTNLRITAKWGESILDDWPTYEGSASWLVEGKSNTWQNSIQVMPIGGAKFWGPKTGSGNYTAYYYVEALPGDADTFTHNGVTYKYHHEDKSVSSGNVTDEEKYGIEGFTYKEGTSNGTSFNNAKFYYTRNSYVLDFNNGEDVVKTESVKYQVNLGSYDFVPVAPSYYETGSVEFAGWYQNPECTGEEVVLSKKTMPASNMILYAKWVPVKHNVTIYRYKNADGTFPTGTDILNPTFQVTHGQLIQTSLGAIPKDPTNGNYKFIGWFYMDGDEEKAFDFGSMSVTRDLDIYARWSSNVQIPYTIKYIIQGTTTEIAEATTGKHYAGETHTFNAKTAGQLNADYQTGYFPTVASHSIAFDEKDDSYEYTFYYVQKGKLPYTVYYVTEEQNAEGTLRTINLTEDGVTKTYYIVAEAKTVETANAIVTESFETVTGYMPDAYQKTLIINGADDAVNQIIFKYKVDTTHAYYKVTHYTQNIDGSWYTYDSYELVGDIGTRYSENPKTITGFTYDRIEYKDGAGGYKADVTDDGAILTADGLEINLYYTRNKYPYKVEYREQGINDLLYTVPDLEEQYYSDTVSHTAPQYWGDGDVYERVSAEMLSVTIQVEDDESHITKNVLTFYYVEREVTINYVVASPGGGTVNPSQETVFISSGTAQGSTAEALPGYKFVGWYDVNNNLLSTEAKFVPQKVNGLNVAATYYAKFEYNLTSLTIKKQGWNSIDADQTFLFKLTDEDGLELTVTVHGNGSIIVDGLTVGKKYKIVEISDWSWRYSYAGIDEDKTTVSVTETVVQNGAEFTLNPTGNVITFTNTRDKKQWLDGNSYKVNIFNGKSN